jgi:hypothetical protein
MNKNTAVSMNNKSAIGNIIGWLFGILVMAIGLVNMFWGNDLYFGIFLFLLAFIYFPPVNTVIKKLIGFSVPLVAKIILAAFIIWAALGVGELFEKIDMMMKDIQ